MILLNTTHSLTIQEIIEIIKFTEDISMDNTTELSLKIESYLLEKKIYR